MYSDSAYGPFGDVYAQAGVSDESFTGQDQDTDSNLYDFPAREYGIQGRWPSPDPAGIASVDPSDPQTWNRYAYVRGNPLSLTDPSGEFMLGSQTGQFGVCDPSIDPFECDLDEDFVGGGGGDQGGNGAGGGQAPSTPKVKCPPNVANFVNAHLNQAQTLASELPNGVTPQEILALAGAETTFGAPTSLAKVGNYFGLHGSGYAGETGTYTTKPTQGKGVPTPEFPISNGFLLSGQGFVKLESPYLSSVNASDPATFFQTVHAHGYGTTNSNYMDLVMANKPSLHGTYYLVGACLNKG
jgi:RHS repeat-associated protein